MAEILQDCNNNGVSKQHVDDSATANSPASRRHFSSASPVSRHSSQSSAKDFPAFTPSHGTEPLPGYQQIQLHNRTLSECWEENYGLGEGNGDEAAVLSDSKKQSASSTKGFSPEFVNLEPHLHAAEDKNSNGCASVNNYSTSKRNSSVDFKSLSSCNKCNSLVDFKSLSSCNKCKPAIISSGADHSIKNSRNSNTVVPLTDSHSSTHSQPKSRGLHLSWFLEFLPRLKKQHKNNNLRKGANLEEDTEMIMSVEAFKKELLEANERRDSALKEVAEMKSSLGDLKQKLEYLESYCGELKKALSQATQTKDSQVKEKPGRRGRGKSIDGNEENFMPISEEAMVEGFMKIVSEARLSVEQFCKHLVCQIEESDGTLIDKLNLLLQPDKLSLDSTSYSKAVLCHLEAIISQSLYQDFENYAFQKNGSQKLLAPHQDRQARFSSYVALRDLSWDEVLRKGTKYYSEEFSKFCDQKMSCIVSTLNWTRPWHEKLLQSFFVTAKCIWLLHLLAFSFNPPAGIFRVGENRSFDPHFMEDIFLDRQRSHGPSPIKMMVMPGFYVQDRVIKCKVVCR